MGVSKKDTLKRPFYIVVYEMLINEYGLTLIVVGANNLKDVSTFGRLDTFVQITYEKEVYKTSILKDSGCSPVWNYEVCLTGRSPFLRIDVLDSQLFKSKLIGSVTIDLTKIKSGEQNLAYYLYNKHLEKESTGVLFTKITLFTLSRNSIPRPCNSYPPVFSPSMDNGQQLILCPRASSHLSAGNSISSPHYVTQRSRTVLQRCLSSEEYYGCSALNYP